MTHDYLRRLPAESYRGEAYVHWTMSIEDRGIGWLTPDWHFQFREILTHTLFRYGLSCPIYCCMPDHLHLLWIGLLDHSDQRLAAKYFRKHINGLLLPRGFMLQKQGYDHVLRDDERNRDSFVSVVAYIARNPERAGLTKPDESHFYPFTQCLVPGYPELNCWQSDYWERFWRIHASLIGNGVFQRQEHESEPD